MSTAYLGIQTATFFDNLEKVQTGDVIYVRTIGETLKYEVLVTGGKAQP